jgi:hypothetical protein
MMAMGEIWILWRKEGDCVGWDLDDLDFMVCTCPFHRKHRIDRVRSYHYITERGKIQEGERYFQKRAVR